MLADRMPNDRTESARQPARRGALGRNRILIAAAGFGLLYAAIGFKLAYLGLASDDHSAALESAKSQVSTARPDLVDRNGEVLATDIRSSSVFAEPRNVLDADEAFDALTSVLPELRNDTTIRKKLASKSGFMWVKRDITPQQRTKIFRLGIPGIGFIDENRRFYPGGGMAGHVLGSVNVDNQGISGIEKYIDQDMGLGELQKLGLATNRSLEPRHLSLDLRVQHVVRDEITDAKEKYRAVAAVGIVLNARTGEVVAMSSVPEVDPNKPEQALQKDRMNRATAGVYEMGSVFKTFNSAMALDSGKVRLGEIFDITPLHFGSRKIGEFHSKGRPLNVTEIFQYSSNNGSARMALKAGPEAQYAFFDRVNFHKKLETELPEVALPLWPKRISEVSTATMSFGHGISVSPMHTAIAACAMVNGGYFVNPTFFPRTEEEARRLGRRVISQDTSDKMRYLLRANADPNGPGSGKRADVPGYRVGGKTGTAEKIENGHYNSGKRFNSFLAAFPIDAPQYVVLVVLDEPKAEKEVGAATAGLNAAPAAGNIIRRIAPMLGVMPKYDVAAPTMASN